MTTSVSVASARQGADDSTNSQHKQKETEAQVEARQPATTEIEQEDRSKHQQTQKTEDTKKQEQQKEKSEAERKTKKKELCNNRHHDISASIASISTNQQRKIDRLDAITDRAQDFYKDKNLNIADYDVLLLDVETKKQAAIGAANELKSLDGTFTCDTENPRTQIDTFKQKHTAANTALKAYKTSVKSLLSAVKSAAEASKSSAQISKEQR